MQIIKTLGLDIGVSSIGWAIVEGAWDGQKVTNEHIIKCGVRIFSVAEHPKTGKSLALPRREARSGRRLISRRAGRKLAVKFYLSETLGIPLDEILTESNQLPELFRTHEHFKSPWQLRFEALKRPLDNRELARVILHLSKRRGYDDITYGLQDDDQKGAVKQAISANMRKMQEDGYQTIGEMMFCEYYQKNQRVRNKEGDYNHCIGRSETRKELEIILNAQEKFGSPYVNAHFKEVLLGEHGASRKAQREGILLYQRALKSFENKIGKCQFFKDSNRACQAAPSAEKFAALKKIVDLLQAITNDTGIIWEHKPKLIEQILNKALEKKTGASYADVREILNLPPNFCFQGLKYSDSIKINKPKNSKGSRFQESNITSSVDFSLYKVEKDKFIELKATHELKAINPFLSEREQDIIAEVLGAEKDWERIESKLQEAGLPNEAIANLKNANLSFSKHRHLSLKALYLIIPLMQEGKCHNEAVKTLQERGELPSATLQQEDLLLPPLQTLAKEDSYFEIANPVVNRALSECRKVYNALIEQYGGFHFVNIELTREVGKSFRERGEIKKQQDENKQLNDRARQTLEELGMKDSPTNIIKAKLWHLQKGLCIYSGNPIHPEELKGDGLDIDHFFPLSKSLDDSFANKVLCFKSENMNKRDNTPYGYLGGDEVKWQEFVGNVQKSKFDARKKQKLLSKVFKDKKIGDRGDFLKRNLADTSYIASVVSKYIKRSKLLVLEGQKKDKDKDKVRVRIVSGSLTSAMRHYWGVGAKKREHHLHHAQDAIVIACINQATVQRFCEYLKEKEEGYKRAKEIAEKIRDEASYVEKRALREPMKDFRHKVQESIEDIFVSHAPSRKMTGALHEETIYGKDEVLIPPEIRIQRAEARDKECKGGKKPLYYPNEASRDRAIKLGKVREVNQGLVKNGEMMRVDIFRHKTNGRYYAVPIYAFDVVLGKLPNKAIVTGKDKLGVIKDWLEMDEHYEFCFSLFRNDAVKIQTREMQAPVIAIYKQTDSSTAALAFAHHSNYALKTEDEKLFFKVDNKTQTFNFRSTIQNLKVFQRVIVSPLGEVKECKPSKRQSIALKNSQRKER